LNIKDLSYFLQICKKQSIRKASKTIFITPQGLSKSIKNLEDELQIQLFYRTTHGIVLTEFGEAIKIYAELILHDVECMHNEITKLKNDICGEISIACAYGVNSALSPEYLLEYKKSNPNVILNIAEYPDLLVEKAVLADKAVLGFTIGPVNTDTFDAVLIQKHKLKILINTKNPLSKKNKIAFGDLKNEKFILVNKDFKTYHNVLSKCNEATFIPNICLEVSEISIAHKYCKLNYGISVTVDYVAQDLQFNEVIALPFEDETCNWEIYMITKNNSHLTTATKTFINHITTWFLN